MYDIPLTPLRLARLQRGMTQHSLGRRARLAPSRISMLERNCDPPTPRELEALARVLGVSAEELFPVEPAVENAAASSPSEAIH